MCQPPVGRVIVLRLAEHHQQRLGQLFRGDDRKVDAQRYLLQLGGHACSSLCKIVASRDNPETILRHGPRVDLEAG